MANYFEITPPEGLSVVKLDSAGRAKIQYTVKNVSGIKRDGRAVLVSVPSAPGAAEKNWVKVDPPAEKSFDPGQSQTFTVTIAVPAKSPAGSYGFRLDTVLVARPDEGDSSSPITFNVAAAAPPPPFKWWIPVAAIVALIIIGVVVWLAIPKGTPVPDLKGKTPQDAQQTLTAAGFVLDPNFDPNSDLVDSTPDLVGKVASQSPDAGAKASKGATVKVQLGSVSVTVPEVEQLPLDQAKSKLAAAGLMVGNIKPLHTNDYPGGTVLNQSPPVGTKTKSNSTVDLTVVQQTVPVPRVANSSPFQAALALQQANLTVAPALRGNQPNSNVIGTDPPEGTQVNVGTQVTLIVPTGSTPCAPGTCVVPLWQYRTLQRAPNGQFRPNPLSKW